MGKSKTAIKNMIARELKGDDVTKELIHLAGTQLDICYGSSAEAIQALLSSNFTARSLYKYAVLCIATNIDLARVAENDLETVKSDLTARLEVAERQVRDLDRELATARRTIAELKSK